jgi:uncharacterized protein (TIGR02001 family)
VNEGRPKLAQGCGERRQKPLRGCAPPGGRDAGCILVLLSVVLPSICLAQAPVAPPTAGPVGDVAENSPSRLNGSISFASDYVGRGLTFSDGQPVFQGQAEYELSTTSYGGLAFTNRANVFGNQTVEVDLDAGNRVRLNDWTIDTAIDAWLYPGGRLKTSGNAYDILEATLDIAYKSVGIKVWYDLLDYLGLNSASAEPNYGVQPHGSSAGSAYLDFHTLLPLAHGLSLRLHAGRQFIRNYSALNYDDWLVGLEQQLPRGFLIGVAYTATDANAELYVNPNGRKIGRPGVYGYVSWSRP